MRPDSQSLGLCRRLWDGCMYGCQPGHCRVPCPSWLAHIIYNRKRSTQMLNLFRNLHVSGSWKWNECLSAVKSPGQIWHCIPASLLGYLFQATSWSSFPLTMPSPCPKLLSTRLNPKPNTTRKTKSSHLNGKRHQTWFSAKRKGEYLVLPFISKSFLYFSVFRNHCCVGKMLKEEYQLSFSVQGPIQKRRPGLPGPQRFFKCCWLKKSADSFHECSLSGEMELNRAKGGKAAV